MPTLHPKAPTFDDVWRTIQELALMGKETDRKIQETDRLLKERALETDRKLQETDRLLKERALETDRKLQETDRLFKDKAQENDRMIKALSKQLGAQGNRLGEFVQEMVRPAVVRLFQQRGLPVHQVIGNLTAFDDNGQFRSEIDLLVINSDMAIAVECKSHLSQADVDEHLERLAMFKDCFPQYKGFTIFGAVAAMVLPQDISRYAYRKGLFVLAQSGDSVKIQKRRKIRPDAVVARLAGHRQPLASIVMPSLNQAAFLPAAVQSVLLQSYPTLELIVADGGSTDGTQAWLAQQQRQDTRLRCVSEPDTGPADALNKALRLSRGTVIGWLNSDDLYTPVAVHRAVQALLAHPQWLMVYGHGEHIDAAGQILAPYPTLAPPVSAAQFALGCFICQPTVFFRRSMHVLLGPPDPSLKTAFDFDYWLRAFGAFADRIGFVDAVQAQSRLHPGCITQRMRRTAMLEGMQLLARHLGHAPKEWLLTYVNELLALPPSARGVSDLHLHVAQTLAEVKPWVSLPEFQELENELALLLK